MFRDLKYLVFIDGSTDTCWSDNLYYLYYYIRVYIFISLLLIANLVDWLLSSRFLAINSQKHVIIIIIYCLDFLTLKVLKLINYCASDNW